jgi:hypothetical protein
MYKELGKKVGTNDRNIDTTRAMYKGRQRAGTKLKDRRRKTKKDADKGTGAKHRTKGPRQETGYK